MQNDQRVPTAYPFSNCNCTIEIERLTCSSFCSPASETRAFFGGGFKNVSSVRFLIFSVMSSLWNKFVVVVAIDWK
jgi:hypothetical protein